MSPELHRPAVDAAIAAAADGLTAADQPLLQLARTLADQMDAAGSDGPGTRLAGTYLTTVRALTARLEPLVHRHHSTTLTQLRARHNRPEPRSVSRKRPTS